jgi:hypothetical protein
VPKSKPSTIKLQVFKGREAKLNKAIFHTLALKGPLTIYDIYKNLKAQRDLQYVRYASINKRVRLLAGSGFLRKTGTKKTRAGFQASIYEITTKACLATSLGVIDFDDILAHLDEATEHALLGAILHFLPR